MARLKFVFFFIGVCFVFTQTPSLFAQEEPETSMSVLDLINASGPIGWAIIVLSVIALTIIIEHAVTIRRDKLAPPELIDELESFFEQENYQEALELCESEPNFLTNVVAAALPKLNAGFKVMEESMQIVGEEESIRLHQKLGWLSLIGNIAPMLGLLGTVVGMVIAFNRIAQKGGNVNPSDLAGGISMALLTTVEGLLVAIPVMTAFFYFRNKVVKCVLEIGAIAEDLIERFRPTET